MIIAGKTITPAPQCRSACYDAGRPLVQHPRTGKDTRMAKSSLAITREQFRTAAKPIRVVINGKELLAGVKEFSTGSLGWNINDKLAIEVAGQTVMVQVGLNLTIIGSKELPRDASTPPATQDHS